MKAISVDTNSVELFLHTEPLAGRQPEALITSWLVGGAVMRLEQTEWQRRHAAAPTSSRDQLWNWRAAGTTLSPEGPAITDQWSAAHAGAAQVADGRACTSVSPL